MSLYGEHSPRGLKVTDYEESAAGGLADGGRPPQHEHHHQHHHGGGRFSFDDPDEDGHRMGAPGPSSDGQHEQQHSAAMVRSHSTPSAHGHYAHHHHEHQRKLTGVVEHPMETENRWVRTHDYHVVTVRGRHGPFRRAVPHMTVGMATFCCCLNVVLPGVGTLLSGVAIVACEAETEFEPRLAAVCVNLAAGLLQLLLAPLIVGWVWSIWWGVIMMNIARKWWVPRLADRDTTFDRLPVKL